MTKLGLPPDQGGFQNDPVLGLVENLGLEGHLLDATKIYVGILAATILFIASNAGIIGASRITYSMATYRQLPEVFRRLHPKLKTPWLSLVVFGGAFRSASSRRARRLPRDMYAFGAMLSFTIAHASIVAMRYRFRDEELLFARGRTFASAASSGRSSRSSAGSARASRGSRRHPEAAPAGPASAGSPRASSSTRSTGAASCTSRSARPCARPRSCSAPR